MVELFRILLLTLVISAATQAGAKAVNNLKDSIPLSSREFCVPSFTEVHPLICAGAVYKLPDGRNVSTAAVYNFLLKDINGCDSAVKIDLSIDNVPGFSLGNDQVICRGQSLPLTGPATGFVSYLWSNGVTQPQIIASDSGWYWLEAKNNNGCGFRDSVYISMPGLSFSIGPDQIICRGDSVTLFGSVVSNYIWSTGSHNPKLVVKTGGVYWAQVNVDGCRVSDTVLVTIKDQPLIKAAASSDIYCMGTTAQLMATGAARYEWTPSTGLSNAYIANPQAPTNSTQTYFVKGTDVFGCSGYDSIIVKVAAAGAQTNFHMPNAFTPNGDGNNDCFGIRYPANIALEDFSKFNRFGQRVFYTRNAYECWDGTYGGKMQGSDGYTYVIRVKNSSCAVQDQKGTVLLIR